MCWSFGELLVFGEVSCMHTNGRFSFPATRHRTKSEQ